MLREQILTTWNNLKEQMLTFKTSTLSKEEMEILKFMVDKLSSSAVLPTFPLPLKNIETDLSRWVSSRYRARIQDEKEAVINKTRAFEEHEIFFGLQMTYLALANMFEQLTDGWNRERDRTEYSNNQLDKWRTKITSLKAEANQQNITLKTGFYIGDPIIDLKTELKEAQDTAKYWERKFNSLRTKINQFDPDDESGPTIEEVSD